MNKYYHVILMDDRMPGMDGAATLQEIRKQENGLCRQTPVIALTANENPSEKQYCEELGFDAVLEKPLDPNLLEKTILACLPAEILDYQRTEEQKGGGNTIKVAKTIKKRKVIVTTDCVSEISRDALEEYGMGMMYLYIQTKEGRFADTIEIDSDNLSQYMSDTESDVKAVSVSIQEYESFFAEQLTKAENVVHISMAKNCGRSYAYAVAAAESFGHVHVVDSGQISCGEKMVALYAAKMAMDGAGVDEIIAGVYQFSKGVITQYLLPNARVFYNNGYTNRTTMILCEALGLHPVLKMRKSGLKVVGFTVGDIQRARKRFIRRAMKHPEKAGCDMVSMTHVALNAKARNELQTELERYKGAKEVTVQKSSFSTACNSGLGTIGISFCKNDRL